MVICMKAIWLKISKKATALLSTLMGIDTKATGNTTSATVKVYITMRMAVATKAIGNGMKSMAKEFFTLKQVIGLKAPGATGKNMGKGQFSTRMGHRRIKSMTELIKFNSQTHKHFVE